MPWQDRGSPASLLSRWAKAKDHEPTIEQVFIAAEGKLKTDLKRFEAALFVLRKRAANLAAQQPHLPFYASWIQLSTQALRG